VPLRVDGHRSIGVRIVKEDKAVRSSPTPAAEPILGLLAREPHEGRRRRQIAAAAEQDAGGIVVELGDAGGFAAAVGRDRLAPA
jgi:hypothetical protein